MGLWARNQRETLRYVAQKSVLNGGGVKAGPSRTLWQDRPLCEGRTLQACRPGRRSRRETLRVVADLEPLVPGHGQEVPGRPRD